MCGSPKLEYLTNQSYLEYPYIIKPRRTNLLNKKTIIKWNKVPGATSYTVSIMNGSDVHWQQKDVVCTEVTYPGEPVLNTGVLYSIKVKSDNNFSSESVSVEPGLGFRVLDADLTKSIQTQVANIKQQATDEASNLKIVDIYTGYGLFAEAIEILEPLASAKSQNAELYYRLGELYSHVCLHLLAEKPLEKALELLKNEGDTKGIIVVQVELAQAKVALDAHDEANQLLQKARSEFESLATSEKQQEILEILEGLISKNWQLIPFRILAGCMNNCTPTIGGQGEKKGVLQKCFPCDSL